MRLAPGSRRHVLSPTVGARARSTLTPHYDDGGSAPSGPDASPPSGATPPAYPGASPMVQQLYQRFASLPLDKLQQLAVMMPANSVQGQMVRRALSSKQMAPAATGAFPSAASVGAPQGSPTLTAEAPMAARGGGIPRRDSGGSAVGAALSPVSGGGDVALTPFAGFPGAGVLAPNRINPSQASTPEATASGASTMPWLQQQAQLQQQGLTPQQIGQAMMNWSPGAAASAPSSPSQPAQPSATPYPSPSLGGFGGWGSFGGFGFPSAGGLYGGTAPGGFPYLGGSGYGGTAFARTPSYGSQLPTLSFSAGNPGQVGPTWAPGQPLLSPSSPITTTPPGFGSAATPPLATPLPASVTGTGSSSAAASGGPSQAAVNEAAAQGNLLPSDPRAILASSEATGTYTPPTAGAPNPGMMWDGVSWVPNSMSNFRKGGAARRAYGGLDAAPSPEQAGMFDMRRSTAELYHPGGFLHSPVAGRTDQLPLAVAADSHVIPADVVSGLGEGNSLNGAHLLDQMFHSGPWGVRAPKVRAPSTLPRPPRAPPHFAGGGRPDRTTSILAAGGEYIVRPEAVAHFGAIAKRRDPKRFRRKSAMESGHDAIDDFIVRARRHVVATTKKLPGPVKG